MTRNIIFRERNKRIVYAVRIAVDRGLSAAWLVRNNVLRSRGSQTARSYSCGGERMSGNAMEWGASRQGTLRSAWWRLRSRAEKIRVFLKQLQQGTIYQLRKHLQMRYRAGFRRWCFSLIFFSGRTPVILLCFIPREFYFSTANSLRDIRKQFASSNPRIALFSQRVFRESCPQAFTQLVIRSGRLN